MKPKKGMLTSMAEGDNIPHSKYYSRKIHWPGNAAQCSKFGSGITLGKGYDLKYRTELEVISDLTSSGISVEKAKQIAKGVKKSYCSAHEFVKKNRDAIEEITEIQQIRLFEKTYLHYSNDSQRFYHRYKSPHCVTWEQLKPPLKEVLIDMKYQGRLAISMIPIFGKNEIDRVINLILHSAKLSSDEGGRQRVRFLENAIR
ncbi:hypothetical protein [Rosenbergiella epipactidis]|uniref:hypothetical protein n=1 Tax=Rosenbergiella epipactidis TaxID=1544694 RepID=UPI001F4E3693|nr:hypothetical protein [Rosenbergiella epipactidis]